MIADRIEAGTFLAAAAALRSKIRVRGVRTDHLAKTIEVLESTGCQFNVGNDTIEADGRNATGTLRAVTRPFPDFPPTCRPR